MRGHRDLELSSVAAVVLALVAALVPWEIVRIAAAVPLCLFLPGYAVMAATFAEREPERPQLLVLSVGVSLMLLALSTFFLNIFPFGLRTASWAVLLPAIVIAASAVASRRRSSPRRRAAEPAFGRPSAATLASLAVAVLIAAAALVLAQRPLPADNATGFSALWMLPEDAREDSVVVGVVSNEQADESFRLRVRVGSEDPGSVSRFELDPGEERTFEVDLPAARRDTRTEVVASLYREDRPGELYRRVRSWLPRRKTFP